MLTCDYKVLSIDGDYAHLERQDAPENEPKLVARALLPAEIYEGCILHYEMMQYEMKNCKKDHIHLSFYYEDMIFFTVF